MQCKECGKNLDYLQLREVVNLFDGDRYKLVCICNAINYISRENYFKLRDSFRKKKIEKETKTPQQFNLIMCNMERCGNSWLAGHISELYNKAYGILPKWNHEISRLWAISKKYPLPQGWNSVYYVDPKLLLERCYDKIIVLQKDLKSLQKDMLLYYKPEALLESDYETKYKEYFSRIEQWWNVMYSKQINDPRILYIRLEDVNNYTEYEMNRILDFLEIPEFKRFYIMCVNRNWQVYSDILPTGYEIGARLLKIQEITEGLTLQTIASKKALEYKYINPSNPYCRAKEEIGVELRSFRLTPDNNIKDVLEVVNY